MPADDLVVESRRVVLPDGVRPARVTVRDGVIDAIETPTGDGAIDLGDAVLMPGFVDTHVHVNEPGHADWEGFDTGTRAAAAGGVTTLVDMPLNSVPVTTTVEALEAKRSAARRKCHVDVGFWGGVVPGNAEQLGPLLDAGVLGFKCFLVPSGLDEFPNVTEADLRVAMPVLAERGAVLLAHAEMPDRITSDLDGDASSYAAWLASRPPESERAAVDLLVRLVGEHQGPVHIVHVSSSAALESIAAARARGLPITAETCPHYLTFAAEEIPDGATAFKCAPPIRSRRNREALWAGLGDTTLELVASDHSPCPPAMKCLDTGDFAAAWGGIASLELGVAVVWNEAGRRGFGLQRLAEWMSAAPARLAGLDDRKGAIRIGADADLVAFDPEASWTVAADRLRQRHPVTPYTGVTLRGRVQRTWLRGRLVYDRGDFFGAAFGRTL